MTTTESLKTESLKGVSLYLIGMMGAGKSTIGRLLAAKLGYRFFDTDHLIEQSTQKSVRAIFAEAGEEQFRQLETQVLAQLSAYTKLVISTGGGIVLDRQNWGYLRHGLVIWLDVPVEKLYDRLRQDIHRPLLQNPDPLATLRGVLAQRQALYAQADVHVKLQGIETPPESLVKVMAEIPSVLRTPIQPPDYDQPNAGSDH